ncbi:MAG: inorganic phosphate transporter [Phycisphaeraceae bacterium]|nr:inorganic phosphate transporter [Phycisphaeraceae bacterium]
MEPTTWLLTSLIVLAGFFMAWNIGANDLTNSMGAAVGSGAMTLRRAILLAAIMEFAGAFFAGSTVTETMPNRIIDPTLFQQVPQVLVLGMIASLLGAAVWLTVATYCGWPVSTTHSIISAVAGFGLIYGGMDALYGYMLKEILFCWILSPLLAGCLAFALYHLLVRSILHRPNPVLASQHLVPPLVLVVVFTMVLYLALRALGNLNLNLQILPASIIALLISLLAAAVARHYVRRIRTSPADLAAFHQAYLARNLDKARQIFSQVELFTQGSAKDHAARLLTDVTQLRQAALPTSAPAALTDHCAPVETIFSHLLIFCACFVSFSHGAHNVANAAGPLASALHILRSGQVTPTTLIPPWALALGGLGIVVGLATWGWRVVETVGRRITVLTPTRAFCAQFAAAATIVLAYKLNWFISSTHTVVGAIVGAGLARGFAALHFNMTRDILVSWMVTLPACTGLSIFFFYALRAMFMSA